MAEEFNGTDSKWYWMASHWRVTHTQTTKEHNTTIAENRTNNHRKRVTKSEEIRQKLIGNKTKKKRKQKENHHRIELK